MKIFKILLLLVIGISWTQNKDTHIDNVENGFTLQQTVPSEEGITKNNIWNRLDDYKIAGASVVVINNGEIDWSKVYGLANRKTNTPITKETLFQSASIGKLITAIAALKLVDNGKIDLDEDINYKLKRWSYNENENTRDQKVTLRHLLSHSAGLRDDYGFLGYSPNKSIPTLVQILNNEYPSSTKKSLEIGAIPGSVERYSGAGYLIIQMLIEDLSGLTFQDYTKQFIFDPLQMTLTTYNYQPDKELGMTVAVGYKSSGKALKNKNYNIYPEQGAAGPWTTAEDLAKLIIAIQKRSEFLCSPELLQEFLTPQINNKGLGVNLKGLDKPLGFWHAGQNLGYTALLYGLIEEGSGAVILTNSDGGEQFIQEFMTSVAMEYNWPIMQSYLTHKIAHNLRKNLVGEYVNTQNEKSVVIKAKNEKLFVHPNGSKKGAELLMLSENHFTFRNAQDYYKLSFKYSNNVITGLTYTESIGKTIELIKQE